MNYWYSPKTRLIFDTGSIPLLGALSSDNKSYHSSTYYDKWGWSDVKKGGVYVFTLVFKGTVPDDIDYVSLIDDNEEYRGCSFMYMKLASKQDGVDAQNYQNDDTFTEKSYYTAYTITTLNLREGPGTDYEVITKIPPRERAFFESEDEEDGFTKVLYINTGEEGYVSSKYLDGYTPVKVNEDGLLEATGKTYSKYSDITLYNDADVTANIKFGKTTNRVAPHTNKVISNVSSGKHNIVVSSPGTIPYVGVEDIKGGYSYGSHFFLRSTLK